MSGIKHNYGRYLKLFRRHINLRQISIRFPEQYYQQNFLTYYERAVGDHKLALFLVFDLFDNSKPVITGFEVTSDPSRPSLGRDSFKILSITKDILQQKLKAKFYNRSISRRIILRNKMPLLSFAKASPI